RSSTLRTRDLPKGSTPMPPRCAALRRLALSRSYRARSRNHCRSTANASARVLSQVKRVIRTNYSNPPLFGGQTVATVLTTPELRKLWDVELGQMRDR